MWAGEKFTGFICLDWHHCAAKLRLASSVHPKPKVYLWWKKNCWEVNRKGVVTYEEAASLEKVSRYHKNLSLKSLAIFFIKISIKYLIRSIDYNSENQKQSKCPTINDCLKKKPFLVFIFGEYFIFGTSLSYFHICSFEPSLQWIC